MTAKAWYWTGLGVLILSMGTSGTGRCWMEKASGVIDQLRAKAVPYMAMAEMATGHTQAGMGHMQAARARFEEQQARLHDAQARIEAEHAGIEAVAATQQQVRHMNVLADYPAVSDMVIEVPGVKVSQDGIVVRGRHGVVVCPRTRMHMPVVDVPTPQVSVMHDPI
ncbi:MAG TPA: hypothetical protein VMT53_19235 [Terriglobales bacterium]|nr:hypothetical protein [Terriglobales bacterium]